MIDKIPIWLRKLVYQIYNNQCCLCRSRHLLQIHHLSYEKPITLEKLELRCLWCHITSHIDKFEEMLEWAIKKYGIDKVFANG